MFLKFLLAISPLFALDQFTGINDEGHAHKSGVPAIQFWIGGNNEEILGVVEKPAIRRSFSANMHIQYDCYARVYGKEKTPALGTTTISFDLESSGPQYDKKAKNASPSRLKIKSFELQNPAFISCLEEKWGKVRMMAPPADQIATVTMPIEAKLRAK